MHPMQQSGASVNRDLQDLNHWENEARSLRSAGPARLLVLFFCISSSSLHCAAGGLVACRRQPGSLLSTSAHAASPTGRRWTSQQRLVASASDSFFPFVFSPRPRRRTVGNPSSSSSLWVSSVSTLRVRRLVQRRSPAANTGCPLHFTSLFFSPKTQADRVHSTGKSSVSSQRINRLGCRRWCPSQGLPYPGASSRSRKRKLAFGSLYRGDRPGFSVLCAFAFSPASSSLLRRESDMASPHRERREDAVRQQAQETDPRSALPSRPDFAGELSEIRRLRAAKYREHKQSDSVSSAPSSRSLPPASSSSSFASLASLSSPSGSGASAFSAGYEGTRDRSATAAASLGSSEPATFPQGRRAESFRLERKLDDAVHLQGGRGREERSLRAVEREEEEQKRFSALACRLARAAREGETREETERRFQGPGRRLGEERREQRPQKGRDRGDGVPLGSLLRKRGREQTESRDVIVVEEETKAETGVRSSERGFAEGMETESKQKDAMMETEDRKGKAAEAVEPQESQEGNCLPIWSSQFDVLTWNLDGLDEGALRVRTAAVASTVRTLRPAVVMFQEVVAVSLQLLASHLSPLYHIYTPSSSLGDAAASLLRETDSFSPVSGPPPPLGCPYFCVLMLCREQMLPLDVDQGALTEWFPHSQMGRHLLGIVAAPMSWPDDRLLFLTSHLESIKEYREERVRQFRRCMQVVTRSFAHVSEEETNQSASEAGQQRNGETGERVETRETRETEEREGVGEMAEWKPAFAAVFGGDTNLRDSELVQDGASGCGGKAEKFSGRPQKTPNEEKRRPRSANESGGGETESVSIIPRSVRDVWEVLGRPDECRYTWDMLRNDNKQMKWRPRLRFDRLYWWSPRASSSSSPSSGPAPGTIAKADKTGRAGETEMPALTKDSESRSSSASLQRGREKKDESLLSTGAPGTQTPMTWIPQSLRLVGVNRLPTCGRFPSDHFGLLARFKRGPIAEHSEH
ncbi:endonuclease/exonuclease/phosphatase family protein [Toxoplasma gondii VAND]|uniref:Endonuclease/exonuclease/phosphatase family protein n=1 Tax=Toxoplasma gondii VAND TaxID=933077 RepID=A0A086QF47_TOXGO|nr:endonuclease/exonuclease/phosphatase family protein [Toxoplasma gondii VAND]